MDNDLSDQMNLNYNKGNTSKIRKVENTIDKLIFCF